MRNTSTKQTKSTKSSPTVELVDLAPDQVKKLLRPRSGFAEFAEPLAAFYKANEEALHIDGIDVDAMVRGVQIAQQLKTPTRVARRQLERLQETQLVHNSDAWSIELEIYAKAVVVGRTNEKVRAGIADFERFMKKARRKAPTKAAPIPGNTAGT